jgi:hypothetical protein
VRVRGQWGVHSSYGEQLRVERCRPLALVRY